MVVSYREGIIFPRVNNEYKFDWSLKTLNNYSGENSGENVSMHAFNFPIFRERPLVSNKEKIFKTSIF